jgi:hypothetical protein
MTSEYTFQPLNGRSAEEVAAIYEQVFSETVDWSHEQILQETFRRIGGPSLIEKMSSLVSSVGTWAGSGFGTVTEEQLEERLALCRACEFWDKDGFGGTGACLKCGCSTQAKLRMNTANCPIDKWGPVP